MASTKTTNVLFNDQSLSAGGGDQTASQAMTTGYGGLLSIKLTNGATGPTVPAQAQVNFSHDNSNWYNEGGALVGLTDNNGVISWNLEIPIGVKNVQVVAGSNTGQAVTIRAEVTDVTAI